MICVMNFSIVYLSADYDYFNMKNSVRQFYSFLSSTNEPEDWSDVTINTVTVKLGRAQSRNYSSTLYRGINGSSSNLVRYTIGVGSEDSSTVVVTRSDDIDKIINHTRFYTYFTNSNHATTVLGRTFQDSNTVVEIDFSYNTTACTPPTSMSVDSSNLLTISGGGGGEGNDFEGYLLSTSTLDDGASEWSSWADETISSVSTTVTKQITQIDGKKIRFKACTIGSAGIDWYSSSLLCNDVVIGYTSCSSPSSLTLSNGVLTIAGGSGGYFNSFTGYGVSYREKAIGGSVYGNWTSDDVLTLSTPTASISVTATHGFEREYRVRTYGRAGNSYYSTYATCQTAVWGNTKPNAPQIVLPLSGAETCSKNPHIKLSISAEPDGDDRALYRKIGSGSWSLVHSFTSDVSEVYFDHITSNLNGNTSVSYKVNDGYEDSNESSVSFNANQTESHRTVQTGTIISSNLISHQDEVESLYRLLNKFRSFYSLSPITIPQKLAQNYSNSDNTKIGFYASWGNQMRQIQSSCNFGSGNITWNNAANPGMYPKAAVFNEIIDFLESN